MSATIYALCDPTTDEIRYIGKTAKRPIERLAEHIREARRGRQLHSSAWIRALRSPPVMRPLVVVSSDYANEMEIRTITRLRSRGYRLTNLTDGGEGNSGWSPSEATRQKKRLVALRNFANGQKPPCNIGRRATPETRARLRSSHLGKSNSPETRAKISAILTGKKRRPFSAEHLENMRIVRTGAKASASALESMRRAARERAKAQCGKPLSPESIAKRTATRRARYGGKYGSGRRQCALDVLRERQQRALTISEGGLE